MEDEKVASRDFEKETHFEGCMPVEALAARGERTLVFGPLKPVGFVDPGPGNGPGPSSSSARKTATAPCSTW